MAEHNNWSNEMMWTEDYLPIMRGINEEAVDTIYLDPLFNPNRSYNLMHSRRGGHPIPEQEEAFCDTWEADQSLLLYSLCCGYLNGDGLL